jgi:hypothetical protein
MPIRKIDMMYGSVLARFCHDRPTLHMIETQQDDSRAVYRINDAVVFMKYRGVPQERERKECEQWQFTFNRSHIDEIAKLIQDGENVHLCLICALLISRVKSVLLNQNIIFWNC